MCEKPILHSLLQQTCAGFEWDLEKRSGVLFLETDKNSKFTRTQIRSVNFDAILTTQFPIRNKHVTSIDENVMEQCLHLWCPSSSPTLAQTSLLTIMTHPKYLILQIKFHHKVIAICYRFLISI